MAGSTEQVRVIRGGGDPVVEVLVGYPKILFLS